MKKNITIRNNTITYQDIGSSNKTTIIFVHGNGNCMDAWQGIVESGILKQFRLIIPDHPGHGSSSAIDNFNIELNAFDYCGNVLLHLLTSLDIRSNVFFTGHSMGCNIILHSIHKFFR